MSRKALFVLLLATGVAVGDTKPKPKHAAGVAETENKTAAARGKAEESQVNAKVAQVKTDDAQPGTKDPEGQSETPGTQAPDETADAQPDKSGKLISVPGGKALGMSVLGNQEAPTSLVIVPWKTSEVGRTPGISPMLDDSRQPVDKEVFMRALRYYEIRSEKKP